MACAYIKVSCNDKHVRTFGGNLKEVKRMKKLYENMTVSEFIEYHPRFVNECKDKDDITVKYRRKHY